MSRENKHKKEASTLELFSRGATGLFFQFPDNTTRISYSHRIGRNTFRHYTSSPDDTIIANADARQYTDLSPYPDIITHGNGIGIFQSLIPLGYIQGMSGCIEATIRSDEYIIAPSNMTQFTLA